MRQDIKIEGRLSKLETAMVDIRADISDLKTNHIFHIYEKLESSKNLTIGLLVGLIANLIGVVLSMFLK